LGLIAGIIKHREFLKDSFRAHERSNIRKRGLSGCGPNFSLFLRRALLKRIPAHALLSKGLADAQAECVIVHTLSEVGAKIDMVHFAQFESQAGSTCG
jgi:hypothetical protein